MTADAMNEWYQQILNICKEVGKNIAEALSCFCTSRVISLTSTCQ